jgi:hypothetical protein
MSDKIITADCNNCESTFEIAYEVELVSDELPSFCPFCGEAIEDITEQVYEEEDEDDVEGWE